MKTSRAFFLLTLILGFLNMASISLIRAAEHIDASQKKKSWLQDGRQEISKFLEEMQAGEKILSNEQQDIVARFLFSIIDLAHYEAFNDLLSKLKGYPDFLQRIHPETGESLLDRALSHAFAAAPESKYYTQIMRIINSLVPLFAERQGSSIILNNSPVLHEAITQNREDLLSIILRFGRPLLTLQINGQTPFELAEQVGSESIRNAFRVIRATLEQNDYGLYARYPLRSLEEALRQREISRATVTPVPVAQELAPLSQVRRKRTLRVSFGSEDPASDHPLERRKIWTRSAVIRELERDPIIVSILTPADSARLHLSEEEDHQATMRQLQENFDAPQAAQEFNEEHQGQNKNTEETGEVPAEEQIEEGDAFYENTINNMPVIPFPQLFVVCILGLFFDIT